MGDVASKALGAARHRARRLLGAPQLPLSGIIHALCDEVERLRGGIMNDQDIARVAHEANRALQLATNDPAPSPPWDDAPQWQRASAISGVQAVRAGTLDPAALHEAWSQTKRDDGWVYGEVKDAEAKTHPCLVDYDDLPPEQKAKDALFAAVVQALTS